MSTTFAIIKENREGEKIRFDIAHRSGIGGGKVGIKWLKIHSVLDSISMLNGCTDKTKISVHAMDNTAQGVKNIGDLITLDKYGSLTEIHKTKSDKNNDTFYKYDTLKKIAKVLSAYKNNNDNVAQRLFDINDVLDDINDVFKGFNNIFDDACDE